MLPGVHLLNQNTELYKEYGFFCINIQHFVLKLHDLNVHCILIKLNGLRRVIDTMVTVIKSVKYSALVSLSKSSVVKRKFFLIKDQVCWIKN